MKTRPKTMGWLCKETGYSRMHLNRLAQSHQIPGELPRLGERRHRRFEDSPALRKYVQELRLKRARFVPKPPCVRSYVPEGVPTPQDPPANDLAARVRDVNAAEKKRIRQLINCLAPAEDQMGVAAVNTVLEQEGISHQDARRIRALRALPKEADKMLEHLSDDHAVVVVNTKKLTTPTKRLFWLKRAVKHGLTPQQLKRSIMAGKVVSNEDVQIASGRGSGILTIENVIFQAGQWYKHIQKADPISEWSPQKAQECLEKLKPVFAIINDLMARSRHPSNKA